MKCWVMCIIERHHVTSAALVLWYVAMIIACNNVRYASYSQAKDTWSATYVCDVYNSRNAPCDISRPCSMIMWQWILYVPMWSMQALYECYVMYIGICSSRITPCEASGPCTVVWPPSWDIYICQSMNMCCIKWERKVTVSEYTQVSSLTESSGAVAPPALTLHRESDH